MDAPPIPRLVDLVHVFKGVVVEQFKKTLEKLLSDSILLWRLLKLLFKILHYCALRSRYFQKAIATLSSSSKFKYSSIIHPRYTNIFTAHFQIRSNFSFWRHKHRFGFFRFTSQYQYYPELFQFVQ